MQLLSGILLGGLRKALEERAMSELDLIIRNGKIVDATGRDIGARPGRLIRRGQFKPAIAAA